jgi:hypothetical protein
MDPTIGILRKEGSQDIRIHIRQDNPDAWIATVEKDGEVSVLNWPAIGPMAVDPKSIVKFYEEENPGYTFVPLAAPPAGT